MIAGLSSAAAAGWAGALRVAQGMAHRAMEGVLVVVTGYITFTAYAWAFAYAGAALAGKQDAIGTAAVLAAILGPLTTFQGFTLAKWMEGNGKQATEVK
jgi:cation transporter-like permease